MVATYQNMRRFPRGTMRGTAQLSGSFGRVAGELRELSVGGAFISGVPSIPDGTALRVWLLLPRESMPVETTAHVLYTRRDTPFTSGGVGLAFDHLEEGDLARVTACVERSDMLYLSLLFRLQAPESLRDEIDRACLEAGVPLGLSRQEVEQRVKEALRRYRDEAS